MENATEEATVIEITDTIEMTKLQRKMTSLKQPQVNLQRKMRWFKQPQMKLLKGIKHPPTTLRHST